MKKALVLSTILIFLLAFQRNLFSQSFPPTSFITYKIPVTYSNNNNASIQVRLGELSFVVLSSTGTTLDYSSFNMPNFLTIGMNYSFYPTWNDITISMFEMNMMPYDENIALIDNTCRRLVIRKRAGYSTFGITCPFKIEIDAYVYCL